MKGCDGLCPDAGRHFELVLAIGKGGHQCWNLLQAVTDLHDRINKIFDMEGAHVVSRVSPQKSSHTTALEVLDKKLL